MRACEEDRQQYVLGVSVATGLLCFTSVMTWSHARELYRSGIREYQASRAEFEAVSVQVMHLLPWLVALSCCLEVSLPSLAAFTLVLQEGRGCWQAFLREQETWEAVALHCFGSCLLRLLGGEEKALVQLQALEPRRWWCDPGTEERLEGLLRYRPAAAWPASACRRAPLTSSSCGG